ncbi:MAG: undecaprenyl-phosphate glucose phosphotransferase [Rhodospirillales bacterium]|nr:undecaprenyl-phosphate glucose phosphotransferase [Rhodospirillales bacterium]
MKRGVLARSNALDLEQPTSRDRDHEVAIVDWDAGAPRQGRTVSETVVRRFIAGLDIVAIVGAGAAAVHLASSTADWRLEGLIILLGALLASNFLRLTGAYRFRHLSDLGAAIGRALLGWLLTLGTLFVAAFFFEPITATKGPWIALWFALGTVLIVASRIALSQQIKTWHRAGRLGELVAVVGSGPMAQRLLRGLNAASGSPRILGVYDDGAASLPRRCMGHAILGSVDDLVRDVRLYGIDTVIVALPPAAEHQLVETLNKLTVVPVDVRLCPGEFALRLGTVQTSHIGGHTFLNVIDRPLRDWRWIAKSIEDRILAVLILALISPVMLAIALLIRIDSRGPALFRQKRYGFNNELIEVLKFRTMYQERSDADGEQLTQRNDPRITRIGAFLRRTSLDELPQFLNVVRGEMSIVGPRPHAVAAKAGPLLYQEAVKHYDSRHRVKPGITGWAQVNGWRGETNTLEQIRKRVEHDLYYIEHWSIALDLRIIARTVVGGFTGHNAF